MSYPLYKDEPDKGAYDIEEATEGFRWVWSEVANGERFEDFGRWNPTRADALRDAADDWDESGSSEDKRFAGRLRALATKAST